MVAPRHLNSLQAIELALRTGSVRAAANALGITPAAAGQRIKALEDVLGIDLLMRGRSGLQPSPALAAAAERLAAAFNALEHVAEMLELQRAQEIHVRVSPDFADRWLRPRLPAFLAIYPNLRLTLSGDAEAGRPTRAPDCELFLAKAEPRPDCELLFHDLVDAVGTKDIETRLNKQAEGGELRGFPLIQHDYYTADPHVDGWRRLSGELGLGPENANSGVRFSRLAGAIDAALAGAGVMRCGIAFIQTELDNGRLVRLFNGRISKHTTLAFQARFARQALSRPQVRNFRDWLQSQAVMTQNWLTMST